MKDYFAFSGRKLLDSFKVRRKHGIAVLLEVALIVGIVLILLLFILKGLFPNLQLIQQHQQLLENLKSNPYAIEKSDVSEVENLVDKIRLYAAFALLAVFILFMFLKSIIWNRIKEKRFTWKNLLMFVIANTLIIVFIFIITLLLRFLLKPIVFAFAVPLFILPLYIHISTIINSSLEKRPLKRFKKYGIHKLHYFSFAHVIILVLGFIALLLILYLTTRLPLLIPLSLGLKRTLFLLYLVVVVFVISAFLMWSKNYIWLVYSGLKRGK